jgi:hypothetical protein
MCPIPGSSPLLGKTMNHLPNKSVLILAAVLASLSSAYATDTAGTVVAQAGNDGMSGSGMARASDFNANDRAFV